MRSFFAFLVFLAAIQARSRIEALFHPYDSSLEKIAAEILRAPKTIDIAIYNMDVKDGNPIVDALKSDLIQQRLVTGAMDIRMIFEGYSKAVVDDKKMRRIENMGVDVRHLRSSKKVHHKLAIINGGGGNPILITGSANWSKTSRLKYNDNVLFFYDEPEIGGVYQSHFNFLWDQAKEFELTMEHRLRDPQVRDEKEGLQAHFNTGNFNWSKNGVSKRRNHEGFELTKVVVAAIDRAEVRLQIATTRFKLRPIYNALLRAASRGVQIEIVVSQNEYLSPARRQMHGRKTCANEYKRSCSSGVNYAVLLARPDYPGHEGVEVRVKVFTLSENQRAGIAKQMHNKYFIVDGRQILSGSFNWSYSSEFNHIENLVSIDGHAYPGALGSFTEDFVRLWSLGQDQIPLVVDELESKAVLGMRVSCAFSPVTMSFPAMDDLRSIPKRLGTSLRKMCYGGVN